MQSSPHSPESSSSGASGSPYSLPGGNSPVFHQVVSPNGHFVVPPYLNILNQPQSKFRFRYVSEMTGTHGCLMAESNDRNKKEYIRVQLIGCQERDAIIRCTLVTNNPKPVPHVHRLGGDGNPNGTEGEHQDIVVSSKNDWIATFSGLTIIHTAKKQVRDVVERRLMGEKKGERLNRNQGQQLKDEADKIATTMDLHSVRLKFETFVDRNGFLEPFSPPVYSHAIHNLKSTHAGDLRIVRIDKVYSCCTGHEEIFIFVEKVNKKDIKIRFFELDENETEVWSAFADFSELDVHHQYAIAFKTPPYQNQNIQSDVNVQFQLYRPSNGSTSEAKSFTYTPREIVGFKRRREMGPTGTIPVDSGPSSYPARTPPHNGSLNSHNIGGHSPFSSSNGDGSQDSFGTQQSNCREMSFQFGQTTGTTMNSFGTLDTSSIAWHPMQAPLQQQQVPMMQVQPRVSAFHGLPADQHGSTTARGPLTNLQQARPQSFQPNIVNGNLGGSVPVSNCVTNNLFFSADELQKFALESLIAPIENGALSEINPAYNDDDLLRMLANMSDFDDNNHPLDNWKSDASGSMYAVDLHTKLHHGRKPVNNQRASGESPSTQQQRAPTPAGWMSNYSINMALALRSYAETGDLTHILTRLRHLMAMQSDDGDNALHDALLHNQIDALRAMLKAASSISKVKDLKFVNSQNNWKATPLHISVSKNQTEATALLLQYGADPNLADANGNTPVHLAATDKHLIDCMQLLLNPHTMSKHATGLKLDARNYAGLSPLLLAVNGGNVKGVELLLDRGADVNSYETKRGRSALHLAVKKREKEMVVRLLEHARLNVNAEAYDGSTALHLAVMDGLTEICALLIAAGANPTAANYVGISPRFSESDSDGEHSESDEDDDGSEEHKGQSPIDLAQSNDQISSILRSTAELSLVERSAATKLGGPIPVEDSGIDLYASKDLSKALDDKVISKLSSLLETPHKEWEALVRSLDLGEEASIEKQLHPAAYLLTNLEQYDLTAHFILEKLNELNFRQAALILEEYLLR